MIGMGVNLWTKSGAGAPAPDLWWNLDGTIVDPQVAYQPKGALSYAASKLNLPDPGTNDASEGTAPTWDSVNGWTFDGINDFLRTGAVPTVSTGSMIVQYANNPIGSIADGPCGCLASPLTQDRFYFYIDGTSNLTLYGNGKYSAGTWMAGGNIAIAGLKGYKNGAFDVNIAAGGEATHTTVAVGCLHSVYAPPDDWVNFFDGNIIAFALYDYTLTGPNVTALAARMAAI